MSAIGTMLVIGVMVIMDFDIVGRVIFNSPLKGVPEIVAVSIAVIVFLQFPATLRAGRVISVDGFLEWLGRDHVRLQLLLLALFHATGAFMFFILFKAMIPIVEKMYSYGDYYGVAQIFTIPKGPIHSIVLVGCFIMMIQYLILTFEFLLACWRGQALLPVGNPADRILS